MMFIQDAPQWLLVITSIVMLGLMIGLLIWGAILEIRFINPFTLIETSNREKWRKAAVVALLQTSMLPIFGLAMPILSTPPEKLPMFLFCNGVWVVVLPVAILYKRWEFERHIKNYRFFDRQIKDKNSIYNRSLAAPFRFMTRLFTTADQKRFFSEGFPEELAGKKGGESSDPGSNEDLQR